MQAGNAVYSAIQGLSPHDDAQRKLKEEAITLATDFAQLRSLLAAQSVASISEPMLIILVSWLVVIFLGLQRARAVQCYCHVRFDGFRPRCLRRYFSDFGVDQPFAGLIQISSEPMLNALH